jgi:TfoX/Sxy family transcriptional regulator of competence genes
MTGKTKSKPSVWRKPTPELLAHFASVSPKTPDVEHRKMFGLSCCFVNGIMFTGVHQEKVIFRLAEAEQREFLAQEGAAIFEPMAGRPMKNYVSIDGLSLKPALLEKWMLRALAHTAALPPKKPKTKKAVK